MVKDTQLELTKRVAKRINFTVLGTTFYFRVERDNKRKAGRIFIQATYNAPCAKTGARQIWHGRKWQLSDYMTEDEIIKTAYCAAEAAVKHEIMEGFKVNGIILFNPHVDYKQLLKISNKEVKRK